MLKTNKKKRVYYLNNCVWFYLVIAFYPKTTHKCQGRNDQEIFCDQSLFKDLLIFCSDAKKKSKFLACRRPCTVAHFNCCLLEFTARKLHSLKILKILKLYGFKIKISYCVILLWNINTKKYISHSKGKVKTYEFLACMRPVKLLGCDSTGTFSWSETAHEQLCMHKDFYHGNSLGIK